MNVKELHEQLLKHIEKDEEYQKTASERLETYYKQSTEKLDKILDNHLSHMEKDLAVLASRTDTLWSVFKTISYMFLVAIVGGIIKLIFVPPGVL